MKCGDVDISENREIDCKIVEMGQYAWDNSLSISQPISDNDERISLYTHGKETSYPRAQVLFLHDPSNGYIETNIFLLPQNHTYPRYVQEIEEGNTAEVF